MSVEAAPSEGGASKAACAGDAELLGAGFEGAARWKRQEQTEDDKQSINEAELKAELVAVDAVLAPPVGNAADARVAALIAANRVGSEALRKKLQEFRPLQVRLKTALNVRDRAEHCSRSRRLPQTTRECKLAG